MFDGCWCIHICNTEYDDLKFSQKRRIWEKLSQLSEEEFKHRLRKWICYKISKGDEFREYCHFDDYRFWSYFLRTRYNYKKIEIEIYKNQIEIYKSSYKYIGIYNRLSIEKPYLINDKFILN